MTYWHELGFGGRPVGLEMAHVVEGTLISPRIKHGVGGYPIDLWH